MALDAETMAADVVAALEEDGALSGLDDIEKERERGRLRRAWGVICSAVVDHIKTNAVVTIQAGAGIVDNQVAEDQTGSIS